MGQWASIGMSMAQSTKEILGAAQGMAQDQQTMEMEDDTRRLANMQTRSQLVSDISQAGRSQVGRKHSSGTIYY